MDEQQKASILDIQKKTNKLLGELIDEEQVLRGIISNLLAVLAETAPNLCDVRVEAAKTHLEFNGVMLHYKTHL